MMAADVHAAHAAAELTAEAEGRADRMPRCPLCGAGLGDLLTRPWRRKCQRCKSCVVAYGDILTICESCG